MESYIATYTLLETKMNLKSNQHGGRCESSTDHVLVQIWDRVLRDLDTSQGKAKASVICGIDFSKSFSRCFYQLILESYVQLGASQWVIDMHAAFLTDRCIQVKVGDVLSPLQSVTGGAVQGSVLGVMDHNAVMEAVDDELMTEAHKYVDDLTTTETIPANSNGYDQHLEDGSVTEVIHAPMSEYNWRTITNYCAHSHLKVNENKTQLLAISSNKHPTNCLLYTSPSPRD